MSTETHPLHPSAMVTGDTSLPPASFPHVKEEKVCAFVCVDGNMPQEMKGKR